MVSRATPFRTPNVAHVNASVNKFMVSAYKLIGFGLLAIILLGIVSYVGVHAFYMVHRSWVVPTVISPNDPIVMDLRARIAHEDWMRHKVLTERATLEVQLRKAKRVAELEKTFQHYFRRAMKKDAAVRRSSLEQLAKVRTEQAQIEREMRGAIDALLVPARKKLKSDYNAKLIDEEQMLRESYQLAQMAQSRLLSSQSRVDLSEKARQLELDVAAFESAPRRFSQSDEPVNYEGLALQREHESSLNQELGAQDEVEALERGLDELDQSVIHYDEILNTLEESPMLRATQAKLALAFVPYDNEDRVNEGAPVYACSLGVLFCRKVGRIQGYWEGEVKQPHPVYGRELRGQLAELVLDDPSYAKYDVLHVNRAPLLL
ncbi:MAG TPA: hypothetical protein VMG12_43470 [Polyangiaceae bacterium]|nr:hypothetical protein [Polyangiaceae bacterium]